MRCRLGQSGVTLVELLVVVVIIGVLVALLLPAISQVRENARRTQCQTNQQGLARALLQFEQTRGEFPGYNNVQAHFDFGGTRYITVTGWVFPLLPLLERGDLHSTFGSDNDSAMRGLRPSQSLGILRCPSDVVADVNVVDGGHDANSYVVNCGLADQPTDPLRPGDWPTNGVFHSAVPYPMGSIVETVDVDGVSPVEATVAPPFATQAITRMTTQAIARGDGLSSTLLLSENVDSGGWTSWSEERVGFVWQATIVAGQCVPASAAEASKPDPWLSGRLRRVNEDADLGDPGSPTYEFARPASRHPAGVMVTFCDGHTQFLSDDVDYLTYCLLMTPRGKFTATPGQPQFLFRNDDDPATPGRLEDRAQYALTPLAPGSY